MAHQQTNTLSNTQSASPNIDPSNTDMLASLAILALNPGAAHPDPNASEREKLLWNTLAKAQQEIREMQNKISKLLEMNLRYAEQLHVAMTETHSPPKRKRAQTDTEGTRKIQATEEAITSTKTTAVADNGTNLQSTLQQQVQDTTASQLSFTGNPFSTFQALQAAQQQQQFQRRLNSALYLDHQNQQRFRSISSSSITLQQALAQSRGLPALGIPALRNSGSGNNNNGGPAVSSSALQMLSQQVMQCTAAMPPSISAIAPSTTASTVTSNFLPNVSDTLLTPLSIMPMSTPLTPLTSIPAPAPPSAHTAPSLSITVSSSSTHSNTDRLVRQRHWRPAQRMPPTQIEEPEEEEEDAHSPLTAEPSISSGPNKPISPPLSPRRNSAATPRNRVSLDEMSIGVPEQIPSIGKFESLRQLYEYKERCRAYDAIHGGYWREKMDSKRRQNWSRISAVYNRIVQLRGPSTLEIDLERALEETQNEMDAARMRLPRYSQLIRKQLNDARRLTSATSAISATSVAHPGGSNTNEPVHHTSNTAESNDVV